jgi:hypothetical protein
VIRPKAVKGQDHPVSADRGSPAYKHQVQAGDTSLTQYAEEADIQSRWDNKMRRMEAARDMLRSLGIPVTQRDVEVVAHLVHRIGNGTAPTAHEQRLEMRMQKSTLDPTPSVYQVPKDRLPIPVPQPYPSGAVAMGLRMMAMVSEIARLAPCDLNLALLALHDVMDKSQTVCAESMINFIHQAVVTVRQPPARDRLLEGAKPKVPGSLEPRPHVPTPEPKRTHNVRKAYPGHPGPRAIVAGQEDAITVARTDDDDWVVYRSIPQKWYLASVKMGEEYGDPLQLRQVSAQKAFLTLRDAGGLWYPWRVPAFDKRVMDHLGIS